MISNCTLLFQVLAVSLLAKIRKVNSANFAAFAVLIVTTFALSASPAQAAQDGSRNESHDGHQDATTVVEMQSLSFQPKLVQITVGQKVQWKNVSYTQHSATEDAPKAQGKGGFDTGLVDPKKESKPVVFNEPGTFTYHCSIHGKTMSGSIVVKGN